MMMDMKEEIVVLISDQHPTGKHPTYGRASQHINSTLLKNTYLHMNTYVKKVDGYG